MGNALKQQTSIKSLNQNSNLIDDDDYKFNNNEEESILKVFHLISLQLDSDVEIKSRNQVLLSIFHSQFFVNILIQSKILESLILLKKLIVVLSRETSRDCIIYIWNLIEKYPDNSIIYTNKNKSLYVFFIIVLELALFNTDLLNSKEENVNINDIELTAIKMVDMVEHDTKKNKFNISQSYVIEKSNHNNEEEKDIIIELIEFEDLYTWMKIYGAYIPKVFESMITDIFFNSYNKNKSNYKPYCAPILMERSKIVNINNLLPLSLYSDCLQGNWTRLYTMDQDGVDFNRVSFGILGYSGPTCLLMKCKSNDINNLLPTIIGVFSNERWKESNKFYGSSSNFIFTLSPELRIFRTKSSSNGNYQYLNTKSYKLPHGLGFGGSDDFESFRLFIPDTLENCIAKTNCLTYETGTIIKNNIGETFELENMEIWGCGGDDAIKLGLQSRIKDRERINKLIEKAQKCDKAAFFNSDFDSEFFLAKTLAHRSQVSERGEF